MTLKERESLYAGLAIGYVTKLLVPKSFVQFTTLCCIAVPTTMMYLNFRKVNIFLVVLKAMMKPGISACIRQQTFVFAK